MGKANRVRRAAKQRRDHQQQQHRPHSAGAGRSSQARANPFPPPNVSARLVERVWAAVDALHRPHGTDGRIAALPEEDGPTYIPVIRQQLSLLVRRSWDHGWLPYDLVRYAIRHCDASATAELGALVIEGSDALICSMEVDARWAASASAAAEFIESLAAGPVCPVSAWIELLAFVSRLPHLTVLVPPPGAPAVRRMATSSSNPDHGVDERQLERVRALLSKAESTTFPEEAEALTAKAQELIARHSLDQALLAAASGTVSNPSSTRLWLDDPYSDAKSYLVSRVAKANRCECVWDSALGCSTLFGFPHDLDAVELLYVSLLAQATGAMARHGSVRDHTGRSRTRSFRRSFLLGFAQRIGERLRAATAGQEQDVSISSGGALLPVLASRHEQIEAAQRAAFPQLTFRSKSAVSNGAGWIAGKVAADLAHLGPDGGQLRSG